MANSNISGTALKAFRALDFVGSRPDPVMVADVATGLSIDRATAYRMLLTLVEAGYVVRTPEKSYRLSMRVLSLLRHMTVEDERTRKIDACLRALSLETEETVHYSVLEGHSAVLAQRAKGSQRVAVDFELGDRSPLHCSSVGKVLLAYADASLVEEVLSGDLPRVAPNTLTDPAALRAEFDRIRTERCAFDDLEFAEDMRCVAVPVFEAGGAVPGAIAISGPASRFDMRKLQSLRDAMRGHADALSTELGGTPSHA